MEKKEWYAYTDTLTQLPHDPEFLDKLQEGPSKHKKEKSILKYPFRNSTKTPHKYKRVI